MGIVIDGTNRTDASTLQGKYVALPDILELVESERNVKLNAAIEKSGGSTQTEEQVSNISELP